MGDTMRSLTSREVEVVRALQSIGAETVCGIEQWIGRTGLSSALSRLKASGHAQHRGGRWSLTPEAAAACPEDLMVQRGAANDVRTPPDGQAPLFPPVEDGADATVLEPGGVAAPLLAVLGEVAEALGGDVPLVQLAGRVREVVAARDAAVRRASAAEEHLEAACLAAGLESGLWHKLAGEVETLRAELCAVRGVLRCGHNGDALGAVEALHTERSSLRREVEAAEQVERALLKALADAGAALAREQAAVMVNNVRARSMRHREE